MCVCMFVFVCVYMHVHVCDTPPCLVSVAHSIDDLLYSRIHCHDINFIIYVLYLCYHSDGGSDSSVSDGPPVHMIGNKSNKRKVGTVVDYTLCSLYNV